MESGGGGGGTLKGARFRYIIFRQTSESRNSEFFSYFLQTPPTFSRVIYLGSCNSLAAGTRVGMCLSLSPIFKGSKHDYPQDMFHWMIELQGELLERTQFLIYNAKTRSSHRHSSATSAGHI